MEMSTGKIGFHSRDPNWELTQSRSPTILSGLNHIHFGEGLENYVTLPVIPSK